MIRKVSIANFKSISKLTFELGRVNVFIGPNGCGKSNILEAIAFASAASQRKLDNEFLISRGIRVTDTKFMKSALGELKEKEVVDDTILMSVEDEQKPSYSCELYADETASYPRWIQKRNSFDGEFKRFMRRKIASDGKLHLDSIAGILTEFEAFEKNNIGELRNFLIFAPENSSLRTFQSEGQILPLGIRGEGLFAHLKALDSKKNKERLELIQEKLRLIDWFENFAIPENLNAGERTIHIRDRYLSEGLMFDQRSANEGFLFLLFYITLLMSPDTPRFFAIDNVDNSLNPKLCTSLVTQISELSKEYDRQVILTTHNPATLDGLDLTDPDQRLFVIDRNKMGETRINQVQAPKQTGNGPPISLSEAFMRGYIGGLPKNF